MAFSVEVPIFVDTNLGTHIAMAVSPDINVAAIKRELGNEHSICFPDVGKISIDGLMVKKRSYFYHLPDSMPIKNVFQGLKGAWFLHVDVTPVIFPSKYCQSEGMGDSAFYGSDVTDSQKLEDSANSTFMKNTNDKARRSKKKRLTSLEDLMEELLSPVNVAKEKKKKKTKQIGFHKECLNERREKFLDATEKDQGVSSQGRLYQFNSLKKEKKKNNKKKKIEHREEILSYPTINAPSPNTSEIVSVTGILTRYFPEFDQVKSYEGHSGCETIINQYETTYQADENETSKNNAVGNYSEIFDQRVPFNAAKSPPKMPTAPLPTNAIPKASTGKLGRSKARKATSPKMSCIPLPSNPIPRASRRGKLGRSKTGDPNPKTSREKLGRSEVGKRLIQAANDLGISTVKKNSAISLYQSSTLVRKLDFEVSDSDD